MASLKKELFSGVFYTAIAKYSGILISLVVAGVFVPFGRSGGIRSHYRGYGCHFLLFGVQRSGNCSCGRSASGFER